MDEEILNNVTGGEQIKERTCGYQVQRTGFISRNVVNLSDRVLTNSEIKVLSEGLNFYPTPKEINKFKLMRGISEFGRKMKGWAYFNRVCDIESNGSDKVRHFRMKS